MAIDAIQIVHFFFGLLYASSRYDKTISIATVKSMYDLVRQVIGLTLLDAPYFTLESLIALYLTSIWAPTVLTDIPIDSWSMSLQALNQCVLADQIKFSGTTLTI